MSEREEGKDVERCQECRFYFAGWCRRYPPVPVYETDESVDSHGVVRTEWPTVGTNDWCGEWQP